MKKRNGDVKEIRNQVLAGIAVMNEDVEEAEELLASIKATGELLTFTGNRFATFAAIDDEALDGLTDFQEKLEQGKLRYCLALAVPVSDLQTEPTADGNGNISRTFCSVNGLPVRTQQEQEDGSARGGYKYCFKRPSFWLTRLVVEANSNVTFYATLFGQYRNTGGNLEYRPLTHKLFDTETNSEVEKPITKKVGNEETASRELNINSGFLFAMVKPCLQMAETARRRQGLRASVNRVTVQPLTSTLGDLYPGLANIEVAEPAPVKPAQKSQKEVTESAPVKPAKKSQKADQTELVAAE